VEETGMKFYRMAAMKTENFKQPFLHKK